MLLKTFIVTYFNKILLFFYFIETTSKIEIAIGDSANITCNITKDLDISSIWFEEINTKRKILQNSGDITVSILDYTL